jgi:hypothetical protein
VDQHRINKEMYTVSIVFPLFCPTPDKIRADFQGPMTCKNLVTVAYTSGKWSLLETVTFNLQNCIHIENTAPRTILISIRTLKNVLTKQADK